MTLKTPLASYQTMKNGRVRGVDPHWEVLPCAEPTLDAAARAAARPVPHRCGLWATTTTRPPTPPTTRRRRPPKATDSDRPAGADGEVASADVPSTTCATRPRRAGVEAPDDYVVRLITDIGKIDDRTFNQYAYEGMQAAEECFGFETSYIETASEADYATNIATSLEGDPGPAHHRGLPARPPTRSRRPRSNPEVSFIGIDQFQPEFPDNYVGVQFREDEGGCLAGVAAGLLTETDIVGVVAGREDVPPVVRYVNAYESCAKQVNPDVYGPVDLQRGVQHARQGRLRRLPVHR